MRYFIIIFLLQFICPGNGFGQNETTAEGLKVGRWTEEYEVADKVYEAVGNYKIIPVGTYDTKDSFLTLEDPGTFYDIKYKGSTAYLNFSGKYKDDISVPDSIWKTFDSSGHISRIDLWDKGINIWSKDFDTSGNLILTYYKDYENDTSFYLTYVDNQLFRKAFYPPENKNEETKIYYPNNDLVISDAEPYFFSTFDALKGEIFPIKLTCKKAMKILSVQPGSDNIQINAPAFSSPLQLLPKDTITLNLVFTPKPATCGEEEIITIMTSEENIPPYRIYCRMNVSHINYTNVETLKHLSLSKSTDKYLWIAPLGTITDADIYNASVDKHYQIGTENREITKIKLEEFPPGDYWLSISSCESFNSLRLTIKE